jgi:bacterial microcompartment shell protein
MKPHPAIAVLDFTDIPTGVLATDAMVKRAPIALLRCGTVTAARFLTLIGGSTAAVAEALEEGLAKGGTAVLDHAFLADVHADLYDALFGARHPDGGGAMAVLTVDSVAGIVRAVEAALKGTPVALLELRTADSGLAGLALAVLRGELHDVEAAVALALAAAGPARGVSHRVVTSPHEAVWEQLDATTLFAAGASLDLGGEGS